MTLKIILTHIINVVSGWGYGVALTSLPVEIVRKYATIVDFNPDNPAILSTLEVGLCGGAAIGCILTPFLTAKAGLVRSLFIMFAGLLVILIAEMIPVHWIYLAAMRTIGGFFTFAISSISPLLVADVLEPKQRGIALIVFTVFVNGGMTTGYVAHWAVSSNYDMWWCMFLPSVVFTLIGLISSYLLYKKKLIPVVQQQKQQADTFSNSSKLSKYQLRRLYISATALAVVQVVTGIDSYVIYASHILKSVFVSPKAGIYGSLLFGATHILACVFASMFIEKYKRRTMMMIGVIGCCVSNIMMAVCSFIDAPQWLTMAGLMVFVVFFNLGPEAVMFLMFAEMFPEKYRDKMNGYAYSVNWGVNILVVFGFDFFTGGNEYIIFGIFGILTISTGIVGTILAPETHQRTLAEIEAEIRAWVPKGEKAPAKQIEMRVAAQGMQLLEAEPQ